jgi:hypothetical protein
MAKKKMRTVKEFTEMLEQDPEYIKMREKKKQEMLKRRALLEAECLPFVTECSRFGYHIKTTWDLMREKNINPELVPIMIKFLSEPNYTEKFREGIARSLTVPESTPYFKEFFNLFMKEKKEGSPIRWSIACVLSHSARKQDELDVIENLIFDEKVGVDRSAFLGAIKRMKGEQHERTLAFARNDPQLKINLHIYRLRGRKSD